MRITLTHGTHLLSRAQAAAGLYPGKYWTLDYSEQCFVGRHLALALGLGVGGLLLIAVGWPLAVAVWLYNRGRRDALDFSDFSMVVYASYKEMYQLRYGATLIFPLGSTAPMGVAHPQV